MNEQMDEQTKSRNYKFEHSVVDVCRQTALLINLLTYDEKMAESLKRINLLLKKIHRVK